MRFSSLLSWTDSGLVALNSHIVTNHHDASVSLSQLVFVFLDRVSG